MAEQSIDKLTLEVEVTAKNTTAAFKELESQLSSLQKALTSLDTSKLKAINGAFRASKVKIDTSGVSKAEKDISAGIDKIKTALAGLESYANKSATGDKSAFSAYERQALSLQSEIDKMWEKFRQQGNVSVPTKAFDDIQDQIKITSGEVDALEAKWQRAMDSGGASDGYMKDLTMQIVEAKANLEDLYAKQDKLLNEGNAFMDPFEKYRDSVDAAQGKLDQFSTIVNQAMAEIDANKAAAALDPLSEKLLKDLPAGIEHVKEAFAGLGSYANAAMNGDGSALTSFERRVTSIQSEIGVLSEKLKQLSTDANVSPESITAFENAIQEVSKSVTDLFNHVQRVTEASQKGIAPKTDSSKVIDLTKHMKEANRELFMMDDASKRFAGKIGGLFKGLGKSITGIGKGLSNAADKGFMKFLKYGLGIRSVYVLFRRLRKAVVDSFGDLQTSGAFFETTRANIEALKTSLATLKFQFGAAFEPIFNAVAPALQAFINYLITAANVISAFMAKLTGKSTYSKVQSVTLAAKNNLGGAAKNAKELNKQLQKFDELNNLTTNNGGGGGGGGGGADSDSARYTEEAVDNVLGDFGQRLAEQIRAGDWEGVGQTISDKLSEAMESIKWDDVYAKARGFGKGLADFLNGLINPRLFGNLGTTLANSINTAFEFLNSFGTTFDWTNFGTSIGTGITNFFQNADFALWGSTVHTWIAGLLDAGISLVDNTDWALIGTKLGDFLENLNISDLVTKLGKLAVKIAEGLGEALLNLAGSGTAGAIAASIATVLGGLVFWGKLGNLASNIGAALGITNWSGKIPKSCGANMLGEIGTQLEGGSLSLGTLTLLVGEFVLVGNIASAVLEKLYLLFGDEEGAEYQREYGTPSGQVKALGETWDFLVDKSKDFFSENGYSAFDTSGSSILDRTGKRLGDLWDWISGLWSDTGSIDTEGMEAAIGKKTGLSGKFGLASVLGNAILGKTGNAKNNPLSKALDTITKKFQTADKTQTTFYNNTLSGSKKSGETLEKSYGDASDGVVRAITNAREDSDNAWANIGNKAKQFSNQFKEGFATLPSDTEKTFKSGYSMGTNQFKELANWAIQKSNEVSNGFNGMPSGVSSKFGTAYIESTNKWSNTSTWAKGIVDTIETKLSSVPDEFKSAFENARLNATARMVDFRTWFNAQKFEKQAKLNAILPDKATIQNRWNEIQGVWKDVKASLDFTATGSSNFNINNVIGSVNKVIQQFNESISLAIGKMNANNKGKGLALSFTAAQKVPFMAKGGILDRATPILAGEAGTEAIVPLQNNTEWLGKMADMMVGEMVKPQHLNIATSIASPYNGSADSSAVAEQNSLLREQNSLLREIASKELSIGDREVFNAVRRENSNYINRTGASAFA